MKMKKLLILAVLMAGAISTRAAVLWDGGGDGLTWSSATNWNGDFVPGSADHVIINENPGAIVTTNVGSVRG